MRSFPVILSETKFQLYGGMKSFTIVKTLPNSVHINFSNIYCGVATVWRHNASINNKPKQLIEGKPVIERLYSCPWASSLTGGINKGHHYNVINKSNQITN